MKMVIVAGPTASGKSDLAVRLARRFNGEIISADSRQVYRGLDLGSGKITPVEQKGVRHHLLNVASPKRVFTAAQYEKLARRAFRGIVRRKRLPIICGGTGFYIQTLISGTSLPSVKPKPALRRQLEKLPTDELWKRLAKLDPGRAREIDRQNRHRLIRAIEIAETLGQVPPKPNLQINTNVLYLVLRPPDANLRQKIKRRLTKRLRAGLITEVVRLRQTGLSWRRLNDLGLEYRLVSQFLMEQSQNFRDASEPFRLKRSKILALRNKLETAIWRYARRQLTWFRRVPNARWVQGAREAEKLVSDFLR